jgi:hypothetical protein
MEIGRKAALSAGRADGGAPVVLRVFAESMAATGIAGAVRAPILRSEPHP